MLQFLRSTIIYCLRKKYSAIIEYVQCMTRCLVTCFNVHHWLTKNNFNFSDHFRHILWWMRVSFPNGINVVVCVLSKNISGNYVTSRVFLSLMLFQVMKVCTKQGNAGI
jgi:hypothetical protein